MRARQLFGNRPYCDRHLVQFTEDVVPLWRASTFTIGLMVILSIGLVIINQIIQTELQGFPRLFISISVAILPALVWLSVLYRTASRLEFEFSPMLPTVFVLAALAAAAIIRPFVYDFIDVNTWFWRTNAVNRLLGNMLISGSINAFVIYVIVRYTVWRTMAFVRRVDGILYTMAASWGYATMFGLLFVLDEGGVSLVNGNFRILAETCAYVISGIIIGYFLGRNRFEEMPVYFLGGGVALAAGANGFLLFASKELNNVSLSLTDDGFSPWPGLVLSIVALIGIFSAIYGLLQRQNKLTRARLGLEKIL